MLDLCHLFLYKNKNPYPPNSRERLLKLYQVSLIMKILAWLRTDKKKLLNIVTFFFNFWQVYLFFIKVEKFDYLINLEPNYKAIQYKKSWNVLFFQDDFAVKIWPQTNTTNWIFNCHEKENVSSSFVFFLFFRFLYFKIMLAFCEN